MPNRSEYESMPVRSVITDNDELIWRDPDGANNQMFKTSKATLNADLSSRFEFAVSVKQPPYSATGNGTTDDFAAIRDAIEAVRAQGGGVVAFPPGTYQCSGVLRVPLNVRLEGFGATIRLSASSATVVAHDVGGSVNNLTIDGNGVATNCFVIRRSNGTVHSNVTAVNATGVGILFDQAYAAAGGGAGNNNHCHLMNCLSQSSGSHGIGAAAFQSDNNDIRFTSCRSVLNAGDGIVVRGTQWRLDGGEYTYNTGFGITVGVSGDSTQATCIAYRPWLEGNTGGGIRAPFSLRSEFTVDRFVPQFPSLPSDSNDVVYSTAATTGGSFSVESQGGNGVFIRGRFNGGVVESSLPNSYLWLAGQGTGGLILGEATGNDRVAFYGNIPVTQPTAVADATDAASVITQLNALLSRLRSLGLIAT